MRFGPLTFGIIGILGMVGGATGCHSSTPAAGSATFSSLEQVDKYQWLEDVAGARSMTWVKEQNARTAQALESDPRFAVLKEAALKVCESPDHLAIPVLKKGTVYNTWQDAQHVRGILRRTTLQGRAYIYTLSPAGEWTRKKLDLPDNQTVDILPSDGADDRFFLEVQGFLTPSSLLLGDPATNSLENAKSLKPQFDASRDVEQLEAKSKDGTMVPYFVVRPKDLKYNGTNPALVTAYGGFQVANTPAYSGIIGKLWLERGGVRFPCPRSGHSSHRSLLTTSSGTTCIILNP